MKMDDQSSNDAQEVDANENKTQHPLKETVIRYEKPFEPAVLLEDWEALKDDSGSSNPASSRGSDMAHQPEYLLELINKKRDDLTRIEVCKLRVTSGQIVVCDPLVNPERPALKRTVPPGTYPIEVFVSDYAQDAEYNTVAVAVLRLAPDTVTHLEMATVGDQNLETLDEDEFFGYSVDAGMGCFMDTDAQKLLLHASEALDEQLGEDSISYYDDMIEPEMTANGQLSWLEHHPDKNNPLNVAMFQSGHGDGVYPSFWGLNSSGEAVCLITDFQVLE
jgi:Protein of unknown function (DUF4241)